MVKASARTDMPPFFAAPLPSTLRMKSEREGMREREREQ